MATYPVEQLPYAGSLLAVNLFSGSTTLLLSFFGSRTTTTLVDDGTRLYVGEDVTMGGQTYEYLGSGTAQPGINLLGLTVPTGFAQDLLLLRNTTTGQLQFVFPDGVPNALGMIALVVTLQPIGYNLVTNGPLCFAEGTQIDTPNGPVLIEDLLPDTWLTCADGPPLRLLANIRTDPEWVSPSALLPVVIEKDAFGTGCPNSALRVTQQHGIVVLGSLLSMTLGLEVALAPALGLVDFDKVTLGHDQRPPRYRHLLCDRHGVVRANGVAAETLLWTGTPRTRDESAWVTQAIAAEAAPKGAQTCCLPRLTMKETRMLLRQTTDHPVLIGMPFDAKVAAV